jgi:quinol monooxygenase YgiN
MKHKWHDEIVAWAGGAEIEIYMHDKWTDIDTPQWHQDNEYRIKPQPKQPKYLYAYYRDKVYFLQDKDASNRYYIGKIEV